MSKHPTDYWLFRAFIGGQWEHSRSCGWYKPDMQGRVPPGVTAQEDHTDTAWPVRLLVLCSFALVCAVGVSV